MNETSDENRAPTDSPRWMRLMASPMSGATDRTLILGMCFDAGSGTLSVMTSSRRLEFAIRSTAGSDRIAVGGAGVDLGHRLALEGAGDLDQGARGVDLVVDDDRAPAPYLADDVDHLGPVEVAVAPLLDDRERRVDELRERTRALGEAEVGDDDALVEVLVDEVAG